MINGYRNCHAIGVDSIVLSRYTDGRPKTRVFIAQDNHELYHNYPGSSGYSLGFHCHKADLILTRISGSPTEVEGYPYENDNETWNHYKFRTQVIGEAKPILISKIGFIVNDFYKFDCFQLNADKFHSVFVPKGEKAVWLITEGKLTDSYNDSMITNSVIDSSFEGLYIPMSNDECKETMSNLITFE